MQKWMKNRWEQCVRCLHLNKDERCYSLRGDEDATLTTCPVFKPSEESKYVIECIDSSLTDLYPDKEQLIESKINQFSEDENLEYIDSIVINENTIYLIFKKLS